MSGTLGPRGRRRPFEPRERERAVLFPLGPGREPMSRRARLLLALLLAAAVLAAAVIGGLLVSGPGSGPARVVTIPAADRAASPALLRAAEAVGFEPRSEPGQGSVEGERLVDPSRPSAPGLLRPGTRAPGFRLRTPVGVALSLGSLRGRVVLLEFFATWCPPCDAEAPHLARLARELGTRRYAFVSVNADGETAPSVLAFHIYFGLPFPALLDPSSRPGSFSSPGGAGPVTSAYRVASTPTFYVLDPDGEVAWAAAGPQPDLLLRAQLERAAGASPR